MPFADEILLRLLKRGESAALRQSDRVIQERLQNRTLGYWRLSLDERDRCHERFRGAQKAGAVELIWAVQGGDDRPLEIVRLHDHAKLAAFLGVEGMTNALTRAGQILSPWREQLVRVDELLERWSALKAVRGLSTQSAGDFADALRVVDILETRRGEDQVVRALSAELFGNSKRIEQLERHLDVLTGESLLAPARHWSEVFGALGLVKEPQPFLIAGNGTLELSNDQLCPIVRPFVGVSNKGVVGYQGDPDWVLTIENLATFHLATQLLDGGPGLIVYTAGMPSPSWCQAYTNILTSLPASTVAYHWGDIDPGGFRIAAHIKLRCMGSHQYLPWLMDANQQAFQLTLTSQHASESETTRTAMAKHAARAGWLLLADSMGAVCVEQERIKVSIPGFG